MNPEQAPSTAGAEPLGAGAQENIAVAGKYLRPGSQPSRRTRDWQLYFFFRILTRAEVRAALASDRRGMQAKVPAAKAASAPADGANPAASESGAAKRAAAAFRIGEAGKAAHEFRDWLRAITGAQSTGPIAPHLLAQLWPEVASDAGGDAARSDPSEPDSDARAVAQTGARMIERGLAAVIQYEILRQHWLAQVGGPGGAIRPETGKASQSAAAPGRPLFDPASINLAFTSSGLKQLGLDEIVLRSFPDAFREGMAARAARLHDTGPSAPQTWYGELGSSRIHGYFTGGFVADGAREPAWRALRRQVHLFNVRDPEVSDVRLRVRQLFARLGMELMHVELGQAPYSVGGDDRVEPILPRIEHFGYRDGISQPFVDMRLDAEGRLTTPAPGGATPGRNRTWTPLATGEVYLGYPDEDGNAIEQPANRLLRHAGTYIVLRKLAQDVAGFRTFLKTQRPQSQAAQDLLGAQIVGRWKNGASLVLHPRSEGRADEAGLNDFRYAELDPHGEKCPLGSHVRRSNPRDTGGRNNVRRHRIMRRSMAYGGPYIPDGAPGDGEERGLLFLCANARIDMQFEVVQGDWLNRGEFLGQAGLGRCPLTGSNDPATGGVFLESGKGAPVTGIPNFVTMRGGEYFFAPSVEALKGLADEAQTFPPDPAALVARGHAFGDVQTEGLFSEERLTGLAKAVLAGRKAPVRYPLPAATYGQAAFGAALPAEPSGLADDIVFVRSYADVAFVLGSKPDPVTGAVAFTAAHSRIAGHRMLGRGNLLVGTDWAPSPPCEREILTDILAEAWDGQAAKWRDRLRVIVRQCLRDAVIRAAPSGQIDLVRDLAADTIFAVVTQLFGVASPGHLTELAMATPFGRRHVGQVQPEWLSIHAKSADENPGLVTLKVWSFLVGLNLVGDFHVQRPIVALGQQAASEALLHIDLLMSHAREGRPGTPETLLSAFVALERKITTKHGITTEAYYDHVRSLVFELALTASAIVPAVFGKLMDASFRFGIDLAQLVPALDHTARAQGAPDAGVEALVYEINRLDPSLPVVMRYCEAEGGAVLPGKIRVQKGQWVAALVAGANLDAAAFPSPDQFSLGGFLPGSPPRDRSKYLMFGVQDSGQGRAGTRVCWGRDRIALYTLVACLRTAAQLPGLRSIPGADGKLKKLLGIASGLKARFAPFTPD